MSFKDAWKTIKLKCLSKESGRLDDDGKVTVTISDTAFTDKRATVVKFTLKNDKALTTSSTESPAGPVPFMMFESSNASNPQQLQSTYLYRDESAARTVADDIEAATSVEDGDKVIPAHSEQDLWAVYSNHYIDLDAESDEIDPDDITGVDIVVVGASGRK